MDTMRTTPRPVRTLAALAVGVLLTTSACGGDDSATDPVAADRSESPTAAASPSEPAPSDVPSEEPAAAGAVPVYYVGDTGVGPRLFREFRKVSGEPALGAAEMAASGEPADPDYRSLFPGGGGFDAVDHTGGTIAVSLSDETWVERPSGMAGSEAELALLNQKILHHTDYHAVAPRLPLAIGAARWNAIRPNLMTVAEAAEWVPVFDGPFVPPVPDAADRPVLAAAAAAAPALDWDADPWHALTAAVKAATGAKGRALFLPLRRALTGRDHGPDMAELLPLITKDQAIARLSIS